MPDMLPFIFPVMADSSGQLGSWLSGLFALIYFPQSPSFVVRAISGMFVALGLACIFPILVLLAFDFALWIWRLYSLGSNERRIEQQQQQQQQQEEQSHYTFDTTDSRLRQRARPAA